MRINEFYNYILTNIIYNNYVYKRQYNFYFFKIKLNEFLQEDRDTRQLPKKTIYRIIYLSIFLFLHNKNLLFIYELFFFTERNEKHGYAQSTNKNLLHYLFTCFIIKIYYSFMNYSFSQRGTRSMDTRKIPTKIYRIIYLLSL